MHVLSQKCPISKSTYLTSYLRVLHKKCISTKRPKTEHFLIGAVHVKKR